MSLDGVFTEILSKKTQRSLRVLPHVVDLVQSSNLGKPRSHWGHEFATSFDPHSPILIY